MTWSYDSCESKKQYDKRGAQSERNLRQKRGSGPLRIYACPLCGYWHLTKDKKERQKKDWRFKKV